MMQQLLQSLVHITAQRESSRLAEAVVTALHTLTHVSQIRVVEIFPLREELFVQEKILLTDGLLHTVAEPSEDDPKEPLAHFPSILECMREHKNEHYEIAADGTHVLWLPVWLHGKITVCVEVRNPRAYDTTMLELIDGIFGIYCNYQSLLDYSERDALTGLYNRKTFDDQFARHAFALAPHEARSLDSDERRHPDEAKAHWLAVVDIDHFKQLNDQYGHLYGDEVLILLANILRAAFRSHDRIFRFGGEEFVILLRSTTLADARKIFDRFRVQVQENNFPQVGRVTVSLGFVGISHETPVVILGHADQALYHAKKNGRNRICFYDELVSAGVLSNEISTNDTVEFF